MKFVTLILLLLFGMEVGAAPATEDSNSLMKGKWDMGKLLEWELFRLEDLSPETLLEFPQESTLASRISKDEKITVKTLSAFLKDKPELTKEEKQELLGVLRLANTKNRVDFSDNETAYKTLLSEELKKMDPTKSLSFKLPEEISKALELPNDEKGVSPEALRRAISSAKVKKGSLPEKELASLLGQVREESAKEGKAEFISDQAEDVALDRLFTEVGVPKKSKLPSQVFDKTTTQGGIKTFFPKLNPNPEPQNIKVSPPKNLQPGQPGFETPNHQFSFSDRGKLNESFIPAPPRSILAPPSVRFNDFGLSGGSSGGAGGLAVDRNRFGNGVGTLSDDLKKLKASGKFSLIMQMSFQGGTNARCQATVVKKTEVGDKCVYKAATARHCVINEENRSQKLQSLSLQGMGDISNATFTVDPNGNDFALLTVTAACADVPVVPLRQERVSDQEHILVETVPGGTMEGRAIDAVSGESLMALDVRSPNNKPFGINPGDSGGGVAAIGKDGRLALVGVISSKPVDPDLAGIGFFAAKSSMDWAYNEIERPAENPAVASLRTPLPVDPPTH